MLLINFHRVPRQVSSVYIIIEIVSYLHTEPPHAAPTSFNYNMMRPAGSHRITTAEDELRPVLQPLHHNHYSTETGTKIMLLVAHNVKIVGGENLVGRSWVTGICEGGAAY
jgi:hypothetical protein